MQSLYIINCARIQQKQSSGYMVGEGIYLNE